MLENPCNIVSSHGAATAIFFYDKVCMDAALFSLNYTSYYNGIQYKEILHESLHWSRTKCRVLTHQRHNIHLTSTGQVWGICFENFGDKLTSSLRLHTVTFSLTKKQKKALGFLVATYGICHCHFPEGILNALLEWLWSRRFTPTPSTLV